MRPTIDTYLMQIAEMAAARSTCSSRAKVGAVIASQDGRILSVGYNGVPKGMPHCDDIGCQRGPDGKHLWLVHAEENAIVGAALAGVAIKRSWLYCTHLPCSHCAALIIQAGIFKVFYREIASGPVGPTQYLFSKSGIELVWLGGNDDTNSGQTEDHSYLVNPRPAPYNRGCGKDDLLKHPR